MTNDTTFDDFDLEAPKPSRAPRSTESREKTIRPQAWRPPSTLPEPELKQAGYTYRWVAAQVHGKDIPTNYASRLREGWEPVTLEEHPEFIEWMLKDGSGRSDTSSRVQVGGLVLCKMPDSFVKQREEYYNNRNQAEIAKVDNDLMRENNPIMPLLPISRKSKFGKGE
jgi:hypothetical protein